MNEIVSVIVYVAGDKVVLVSHQAKAERAKGVAVLEVGGVYLVDDAFCDGVCEF